VIIAIERDRIVSIKDMGGTRTLNDATESAGPGVHVIDGKGGYVLPGFVDVHDHIGTPTHLYGGRLTHVDYVLRLLLAHGITTVRDTGALMGLNWTVALRERNAKGEVTAPRGAVAPRKSRLSGPLQSCVG